MFTATAITAGLIAGAVTIGSALEGDKPLRTSADAVIAQEVEPSPASGPLHNEAPSPVTSIPKDDPTRGMVYGGLVPAASGDKCVGVYKVNDQGLCTHGPDAPPRGVDVHKSTAPVVATTEKPADLTPTAAAAPSAADLLSDAPPVLDLQSGKALGGSAAPAGTPSAGAGAAAEGSKVVCEGDGSTGNRVQVMYVHAPGNDRFAQYLASFKKWASDTDTIYNASAEETGGVRHIRFVTEADCSVSVLNVELSAASLQEFGASNKALAAQGFNRKDRKYMVFADANVYCGIGTFNGDERPGQDNLSNFGPSYGRTDNGCWGGSTAAHELGHNLGAVNNSAPHTSKGAHCVDEWDIMCYSDSPYYPKMQTLCPNRAEDDRLDCNHDDYFNTDPQPGSYLTTHWNIANNQFLFANGGSNPNPNPTPTPTKSPTPSPTTPTPTKSPTPSPSPTDSTPTPSPSPTSTTGPKVTVGQITTNSAVLSWTAVADASGYDLQVNGRSIATVTSSVVRLVNLKPDTEYKVAVAVKDKSGKTAKPGRTTAFRTTKAAGPTPTKPGTRYLMINSLTGQAADMWGGSTRDGAVLIGYQRHGYSNQQWLFEDAGDGYLKIRSARSDKCLQIGGQAVAGQYVMQQPCSSADSQQWKIASAGSGYALTAKGSSLVLGTSKRWYYGGWLLELQQPSGQSYQNWTIQAAS
ncbi:RICIN domain-containing protein [Streptomyces sp. NRRL B-24484]|uniref:RICIN domain-containing protein n=1 Tax=Streptomyces sp. NRRL B-24484 TaxID=1463833 RepID=UPI000AF8B870|nr:RICIN domain-containing protein [Streptomyces sp. NRRL B-24484]